MLHNTIGGPIGPGAIVQIIRSGDVIPKIIKVIVPIKETEVKMPSIGYKWNDTKVDIITTESQSENPQIKKKKILRFINALGIEYVKIGMVKKLMKAGINSIMKLLNANTSDFLTLFDK